ncbi:MAG TPA: carboxypeptidase-like regulatory domain-containing protein [Candidatus Paceibacterota bacterium]
MNSYKKNTKRGTSFIDIIIGLAIVALIFWGIGGTFLLAINLISNVKAKAGALSLATERTEFLRSLSYDSVGTVGGIPTGDLAQSEEIELNDVSYTRRTFVQYVDSPQDGIGASDANGITADYKSVKVELLWDIRGITRSLALISTIVPKGIETITGGGTLIINVIDALGLPVADASVHVENGATDPAIDVITFSNEEGQVIFPGSPEANSYKITVTKAGYSSGATYDADTTNVAPSPGHLSIFAGQVSQITLSIDRVAQKTIKIYEWLADNAFLDLFLNGSHMEALTNAEILDGDISLTRDNESNYYMSGEATSVLIAPAELGVWKSFSWDDLVPANTSIAYHVLYESSPGVWALVPEGDLSGNSSGFTIPPVDVSGLSIDTYPGLKLEAELSSSDPLLTPYVHDWTISYEETVPLSNFLFSMKGAKTIGVDASASPIYKYDTTHTTDSTGTVVIDDLEWDTYTVSLDEDSTGYDIKESCDLPQPRSISPGVSTTTTLYLVPHTTNSLHVSVLNTDSSAIPHASVHITRSGVDKTLQTSSCGQTFFSNLGSFNDYTITVSFDGFNTETVSNFEILGSTDLSLILTAQ